jgi:hypothetical protein
MLTDNEVIEEQVLRQTPLPLGLMPKDLMAEIDKKISYYPETGDVVSKTTGYKLNGSVLRISGGKVRTANAIHFLMTGIWPYSIHFLNGDRTDFRWENLREGFAGDQTKKPTNIRKMDVDRLISYDPATGHMTWLVKRGSVSRPGEVIPATVPGHRRDDGKVIRAAVHVNGHRIYCHQLAWLVMTGEWPDGPVHHKNSDPTDISWDNLYIPGKEKA